MPVLRIASWNLRYDIKPDTIPVSETLKNLPKQLDEPIKYSNSVGERPWSTRRVKVAQQLLGEEIVVAGFQEVLQRQLNDMIELFKSGGGDWGYVGVARNDGKASGEFSPVFFDKSKVTLLHNDTFWLSNSPFKPGSIFPGAGCVRICTVARLQLTHETERSKFVVINTHLDHVSESQRQYGASLVLARARYEASKSEGPVFVTGDFNSSATGKDDSGAYKIITGAIPPVPIDPEFASKYSVPKGKGVDFRLIDLRESTQSLNISGNFATFTDFKSPENASKSTGRIDFVFGDNISTWTSEFYKVPSALSDDGTLASDHRPIFSRISW